MITAGIEALNIYCGSSFISVDDLAKYRNLNNSRFQNLMMKEKSVPLPFEDPVSNGINAAKPIIDGLSEKERAQIDMIITCTESGIDFGKSMSTYIHHYLELNRNCRLFELKSACYSGTAGFHTAVNFVLSGVAPGKKVLVICTDVMRVPELQGPIPEEFSFMEPSSGSGAVAILISNNPVVFQIDPGANGYYGYEVMDTCRPIPDGEAGSADLSLLSYLDCCEHSFKEYQERVEGTDYGSTFNYLAFHTPFAGMVKGAHRSNMRKFKKAKPADIEADFEQRLMPSLQYCQRVGNIMGATSHLALASTIANGNFEEARRIGIFSYGSGCCSEFYSGVADARSQEKLRSFNLEEHLNSRSLLSMETYEDSIRANWEIKFGTKDYAVDMERFPDIVKNIEGKNRLVLTAINNYQRIYKWI
jgi:polyketide biosynthesis 3-hydroxy-3-methylglutaryl-CoA synthase-like enzyme PksG